MRMRIIIRNSSLWKRLAIRGTTPSSLTTSSIANHKRTSASSFSPPPPPPRRTCMNRFFSSSSQQQNHPSPSDSSCDQQNKKDKNRSSPQQLPTLLAVGTAKGLGQVIFLNSISSGVLLGCGLAVGHPYVAACAVTGSLTSSLVAFRVFVVDDGKTNDNNKDIEHGLWSYNGALMGCVSAVLVAPTSPLLGYASTVVGAAAATGLTGHVPKVLPQDMPQWTWAFNVAALVPLVYVQPLSEATATAETTTESETAIATVVETGGLDLLVTTPLVGLSQIFLVENALSGLGIVAAVATYSPLLAVHALAGSTVGAVTGLGFLGAPLAEITSGLWSYNAALVSLGVGVFCVPNRSSVALSLSGAAVSTAVFAVAKPVLFQVAAVPCLTLPFCVTMSGCWYAAKYGPTTNLGLALAQEPHSPEQNK